ncbi:MAG: hypothetical protein ACJ8FD_17200, partial [Bradyrhizobium canariense]
GVGATFSVVAAYSAVIARLDRAIQYAETPVIQRRGHGVLDTPLDAYAKASAPLDLNPGEALA